MDDIYCTYCGMLAQWEFLEDIDATTNHELNTVINLQTDSIFVCDSCKEKIERMNDEI